MITFPISYYVFCVTFIHFTLFFPYFPLFYSLPRAVFVNKCSRAMRFPRSRVRTRVCPGSTLIRVRLAMLTADDLRGLRIRTGKPFSGEEWNEVERREGPRRENLTPPSPLQHFNWSRGEKRVKTTVIKPALTQLLHIQIAWSQKPI